MQQKYARSERTAIIKYTTMKTLNERFFLNIISSIFFHIKDLLLQSESLQRLVYVKKGHILFY
jgi:hypothetical protein